MATVDDSAVLEKQVEGGEEPAPVDHTTETVVQREEEKVEDKDVKEVVELVVEEQIKDKESPLPSHSIPTATVITEDSTVKEQQQEDTTLKENSNKEVQSNEQEPPPSKDDQPVAAGVVDEASKEEHQSTVNKESDETPVSDVQVTTTTSGEDTVGKEEEGPSRESKTSSSIRQEVDSKSQGDRKSLSSQQRRKEKRKKKRSSSTTTSLPKLRHRSISTSSKIGNVAEQYLQNILYPYFVNEDQLGGGALSIDIILQILYLPQINLQLTEEDLPLLQSVIEYDERGYVDYAWLATNIHKIITFVYSHKPETKDNIVELQGIDGTRVMYNKKSGEIIDHAEDGMDLFESTIIDLFQTADTDKKGHITKDSLKELLSTKVELDSKHIDNIMTMLPEGDISYEGFKPIGREVVLKVYQATDQTDSEWMYLNSPKVGSFYLNKITGETKRDPTLMPDGGPQEMENAYSQINTLTLQLEQERERSRQLENQIAQFNEDLEETVAQLDETGRQLDLANLDLQSKDAEIMQLQEVFHQKEEELNELTGKGVKASTLELELERLRQELSEAHLAISERDAQLGAQEQAIQDLNFTIDSATDELKNAHGVIDAKDSSISTLQYDLTNEQGLVKELSQKMPSLESKLSHIVTEMGKTHKNLEEKTSQLHFTRKQLKGMREKNTELEKRIESLENMRDKLAISENENHTLKSFLTTKTAMIEKRKREIQELREKLAEMESRDNRRAIILADVLEKTARAYQQQIQQPSIGGGGSQMGSPRAGRDNKEMRPISAPLPPPPPIKLEDVYEYQEVLKVARPPPPHTTTEYVDHATGRNTHHGGMMRQQNKKTSSQRKTSRVRSQTVPRLPPIHKPRPEFGFVTNLEMRQKYRRTDAAVNKHSPETCSCEVCVARRGEGKQPEYLSRLSGKTGLDRLREETDRREEELAKQVKIGQRVLVQVKKSMYDIEPRKFTGVIKFVGKIDSEYMDNRVYVGVKLDEPAGNMNGIYKGKKYFDCPPGHGKMLHITSILAVMPRQGVMYRPLQLHQEGGDDNNGGLMISESGQIRRRIPPSSSSFEVS